MTGQYIISIAIVIILIPMIAFLPLVESDFAQEVKGQAEETFGQNITFLEEIEQMQRQTKVPTLADQNQTNASTTQMPEMLLQDMLNGPHSLTYSANESHEPKPRIITSGGNMYIVWGTNKTGNWEVMLRASNDNGETFGEMINLSNSSDTDSENADITASGTKVVVIWQESPAIGVSNSVLRISNDNGKTFGPILDLFSNSTIGERETYSVYENSSYGIRIQYLSDWKLAIGEQDNIRVIDIAGFSSPLEYRLDDYREKLWISLDNLRSENTTLKEYADAVIIYKNQSLREFRLLDNDTYSTILAGYPAYRLVYTSSLEDGMVIKHMEIGTKVDERVYYLNYYAEVEKYPDYLPVIQDMINSFEIQSK